MINITFPDGNVRSYEAGVSGADIALSISKSLSKKAVAMKVDGKLCDLSKKLEQDAAIEIVLRDDEEALDLIRHDTAHIMAEAVQELWPGTQVTIGPVIEYGFYYDFDPKEPFSTDDFPKIEKKMREIVQRNDEFVREVWDRDEAMKYFMDHGEKYKAELIRDLPEDEEISIYR